MTKGLNPKCDDCNFRINLIQGENCKKFISTWHNADTLAWVELEGVVVLCENSF